MKILIDAGHPAHFHLFRNFAFEMQKKGHDILFTCREKECTIQLFQSFSLQYISLGRTSKSIPGKFFDLFSFGSKLKTIARKFRPDVFLSHGSHTAAHISSLLRKPHISFEDTFNFEQIWLYKFFTEAILTSDYDHPLKSRNLVRYKGYHELAYLHPNWFTPSKEIRNIIGVKESERYVILRFVSWEASHDIGHNGIALKNKLKAVREFQKYAKVFISSETSLPEELIDYHLDISPELMHDVMAQADVVFGESATMAAEAAILGVPGIFVDNTGRYYTKDLSEKYGLVYNYSESEADQEKAIQKGVELLKAGQLKEGWKIKNKQLLDDKIDVTLFLVWFIEHWPESKLIMQQDPDYQNRFK